MKDSIGTQCYGLGKEFEEDFAGTLKQIAAIGYTSVEPYIILQETQDKIRRRDLWSYELLREAKLQLDALGVSVPSAHIGAGFGNFTMPCAKIAEGVLKIHEIAGTECFVFSGLFSDAYGARKWGKLLQTLSEAVHPYGCTVVYHNHDTEWKQIRTGRQTMRAIDCFYAYAGPEVLLEFDIGWAAFAYDEIRLAQRYGRQIAEMHCRDFAPAAFSGRYTRDRLPEAMFVPVGDGCVHVKEIIGMRHAFPHYNGNLIVEQEKSAGSMLENIADSYRRIRSWLDGEEN